MIIDQLICPWVIVGITVIACVTIACLSWVIVQVAMIARGGK